jgi:hypothetical protein
MPRVAAGSIKMPTDGPDLQFINLHGAPAGLSLSCALASAYRTQLWRLSAILMPVEKVEVVQDRLRSSL